LVPLRSASTSFAVSRPLASPAPRPGVGQSVRVGRCLGAVPLGGRITCQVPGHHGERGRPSVLKSTGPAPTEHKGRIMAGRRVRPAAIFRLTPVRGGAAPVASACRPGVAAQPSGRVSRGPRSPSPRRSANPPFLLDSRLWPSASIRAGLPRARGSGRRRHLDAGRRRRGGPPHRPASRPGCRRTARRQLVPRSAPHGVMCHPARSRSGYLKSLRRPRTRCLAVTRWHLPYHRVRRSRSSGPRHSCDPITEPWDRTTLVR